jgi:hypothetical protein
MDLQWAELIWKVVAGVFTAVAASLAGLWAYSRFVLERGLLPATQFTIDCSTLSVSERGVVIEVTLRLKNLGTAALIVRDLRLDLRYLTASDALSRFGEIGKPTFGRLQFAHSAWHDLRSQRPENEPRGTRIVEHDTFVQPGVDQPYAFITSLPASANLLLVWASFGYAQRPSPLQERIVRLSRRMGLLQYSLDHVSKPHTTERAFRVGSTADNAVEQVTGPVAG